MLKCDKCGKFCSPETASYNEHNDYETGENYLTDIECKDCRLFEDQEKIQESWGYED